MIQYKITLAKLKQKVENQSAGWLERARVRTGEFRASGKYEESSSIWSEVKPAYMLLQGDCKCAYCERKLESIPLGKVEQDVEHFRPKGSVRSWKAPRSLTDSGIAFGAPPPPGKGYFLLAYHPFNYAAACKPCNSALKKDYFPIAGAHTLDGEDPAALTAEKPYLLYPIGSFDDDPTKIISFYGLSPRPVATAAGFKRDRALVTIEFFKLDDVLKRKNLFRERALVIIALYPQLEKMLSLSPPTEKAVAVALVKGFTQPTMQHTNCALSFIALHKTKPNEARDLFLRAVDLLISMS